MVRIDFSVRNHNRFLLPTKQYVNNFRPFGISASDNPVIHHFIQHGQMLQMGVADTTTDKMYPKNKLLMNVSSTCSILLQNVNYCHTFKEHHEGTMEPQAGAHRPRELRRHSVIWLFGDKLVKGGIWTVHVLQQHLDHLNIMNFVSYRN